MAEKPSQRIATVSNKINVQQYMCVCLYASGNYRVNVLIVSERGTGLEMCWCMSTHISDFAYLLLRRNY